MGDNGKPLGGLIRHMDPYFVRLLGGLVRTVVGLERPPRCFERSLGGLERPRRGFPMPPIDLPRSPRGLPRPTGGLSWPLGGISRPPRGLKISVEFGAGSSSSILCWKAFGRPWKETGRGGGR